MTDLFYCMDWNKPKKQNMKVHEKRVIYYCDCFVLFNLSKHCSNVVFCVFL